LRNVKISGSLPVGPKLRPLFCQTIAGGLSSNRPFMIKIKNWQVDKFAVICHSSPSRKKKPEDAGGHIISTAMTYQYRDNRTKGRGRKDLHAFFCLKSAKPNFCERSWK
jgi:hypothetical protein